MKVLFSIMNKDVSRSQKHKHPVWEMVYRLSGESHTTIGNKTHLISTGDLYLVPPETLHFDASDGLFSDLVIQIDFLEFSEVLVLHDDEPYVECISKMINRMITQQENNFQRIADSLMEALIQYIKRFSMSEGQNPLVQRLKNAIFENIENYDFDLSEEIKHMGYHTDYIRRCFKAETQKTPLSYLTDLRMCRAKKLLIMPTCESIEIISAKCGFRDSFYFSACFKKHTGLSPLQYRKQHVLKY